MKVLSAVKSKNEEENNCSLTGKCFIQKIKITVYRYTIEYPGHSACGIIIQDENGIVLKQTGKYLGYLTSQVADYEAVIFALDSAIPYSQCDIEMYLQTSLVECELKYKNIVSPSTAFLNKIVKQKLSLFRNLKIKRIASRDSSVQKAAELANDAFIVHFF